MDDAVVLRRHKNAAQLGGNFNDFLNKLDHKVYLIHNIIDFNIKQLIL